MTTTATSYDLETLEKDLSAHLVFGAATATAFSLLAHFAPTNQEWWL